MTAEPTLFQHHFQNLTDHSTKHDPARRVIVMNGPHPNLLPPPTPLLKNDLLLALLRAFNTDARPHRRGARIAASAGIQVGQDVVQAGGAIRGVERSAQRRAAQRLLDVAAHARRPVVQHDVGAAVLGRRAVRARHRDDRPVAARQPRQLDGGRAHRAARAVDEQRAGRGGARARAAPRERQRQPQVAVQRDGGGEGGERDGGGLLEGQRVGDVEDGGGGAHAVLGVGAGGRAHAVEAGDARAELEALDGVPEALDEAGHVVALVHPAVEVRWHRVLPVLWVHAGRDHSDQDLVWSCVGDRRVVLDGCREVRVVVNDQVFHRHSGTTCA